MRARNDDDNGDIALCVGTPAAQADRRHQHHKLCMYEASGAGR